MTEPLFGVIVAGRPLQANFTQAGENEFMIELPNADTVNHIVLFLTGVQPFPEGFGGSVYIRWPQPGEVNWHYLGFISNNKPSAIFKISQLSQNNKVSNGGLFAGSGDFTSSSVMIGVMLEPLTTIESRVAAENTATSMQATLNHFIEKMTTNLFNHMASYAVSLPTAGNPSTTTEYVPARAIHDWYNTFTRRFQANPNFWKYLQ